MSSSVYLYTYHEIGKRPIKTNHFNISNGLEPYSISTKTTWRESRLGNLIVQQQAIDNELAGLHVLA